MWREQDPDAFGVALATDERKPSKRRCGVYRFQITIAYFIRWFPMERRDASATPLENGLGLFSQQSMECAKIFGSAPSSIVEGRPKGDMQFLHWLGGKELVLHLVSSRDIVDRELAVATKDAVAILGHFIGRAQKRVCAEVLRRSLYMHRWVNNHRNLSAVESLEDLAERAKLIIQDVP